MYIAFYDEAGTLVNQDGLMYNLSLAMNETAYLLLNDGFSSRSGSVEYPSSMGRRYRVISRDIARSQDGIMTKRNRCNKSTERLIERPASRKGMPGFILLFLMMTLYPSSRAAFWQNDDGFPPASWGHRICVTPDGYATVGGEDGRILQFDGSRWTYIPTWSYDSFNVLDGTSASDLYFGIGNIIRHYNGSEFTDSILDTDDTARVIQIVSPTLGWVLVGGTEIFEFDGSRWEKKHVLDTFYRSLFGFNEDDLFVIGDDGCISHYDGTEWQRMTSNTTEDLYDIHGSSPDNVFVCGPEGTVLRYNGSEWIDLNAPSSYFFYEIWVFGSDDVLLAPGLVHWNGSEWKELFNTGNHYPISQISSNDAGLTMFTTLGGGVYRVEGETVTPCGGITSKNINCIFRKSPTEVYLAGDAIIRFDGITTQLLYDGLQETVKDMWVDEDGLIYLVSDRYCWTFDGVTLRVRCFNPDYYHFYSVWGSSENDIYIGGYDPVYPGDGLYHYDGHDWTEVLPDEYLYIQDIWGIEPYPIYAVGMCETIAGFDGQSWSLIRQDMKSERSFYGVFGSSTDSIYAVGFPGFMLHYDGVNWDPIELNVQSILHEIDSLFSGELILRSGHNTMVNLGDRWEYLDMNHPIALDPAFIWGDLNEKLYSYQGNGSIWTWEPQGITFSLMLSSFDFHPDDEVFIYAYVQNFEEPIENVPVVILLEVFGELFFWPSWSQYNPQTGEGFDVQRMDIAHGINRIEVLPKMIWPYITDELSGILLYGAMLTDDLTAIRGDYDRVTIAYSYR